MEESAMEPIHPKQVGRRLLAICKALGMLKGHFADSVEIDRSSFTKMTKGEKPLLPPEAWKIYKRYRIDLNFIYGGHLDGVPEHLSRKLTAALQSQNE